MDVASQKRHRWFSVDGKEIYHISIIDYLQLWNANKIGERFLKTKFLGKKGDELSAVEPNFYRERFVKVLTNRIITVALSEKISEATKDFKNHMDVSFDKIRGASKSTIEKEALGNQLDLVMEEEDENENEDSLKNGSENQEYAVN